MSSEGYRVAVVGATGQVGTLMLRLLRERRFPAREIVAFASERSAGRELDGGLVVRQLTEEGKVAARALRVESGEVSVMP